MREEVTHWWLQAKEDLDSAQKNLKLKKYYLVAFLCQQSIEKGLKAILLKNKLSPGSIHSLPKLGEMVKIPQTYRRFLRSVSAEYYMSRYPDANEDVPYKMYNEMDAVDMLKQTKEVFAWLTTQMNK